MNSQDIAPQSIVDAPNATISGLVYSLMAPGRRHPLDNAAARRVFVAFAVPLVQ
ncbi:hypothetical protein [Cryobacterium ruanii]|uniref:hypothetical protein n=1 Tax=Cryobacterium ruanii TaxID=1259197 RepID=UPI00141BA5A6|nr:hypothetical protein [Cryobacterium ruanii]